MRTTGHTFEQRALTELERAGLKLLTRNYATRFGELDLVMLERNIVVFVEVRYRRQAAQGDAAASITASKKEKLIKTASNWLAAHPSRAGAECRFDVITYDGPPENACCNWLRGAFEAA